MNSYLMFYGASSIVSIAFNLYSKLCYQRKNKKLSMENITFPDLSSISKDVLKEIDRENRNVNMHTVVNSMIPIYNIVYSITEMSLPEDFVDSVYRNAYDDIVSDTNKTELKLRILYLKYLEKLVKEGKSIPEDFMKSIVENEYSINEKEFKKLLKLSNIKYDKSYFKKSIEEE